jgi:predicted O-methyltransferase YrrM
VTDWTFPSDIRGWLSEEEGRALADLARGKRVLEIGSFCGKSTICMAQVAEGVTCIDPFDARATSETGDTLAEFNVNVDRYGLLHKVNALRGPTSEVAPTLESDSFDLVFIDGDHSFEAVGLDISHAERLLVPGGLIAFHDFDRPIDVQVTAAVKAYLSRGAELLQVAGTVAVVKPPRKLGAGASRVPVSRPKARPLVFLGMPSYDGKCSVGTAESFFLTPTRGGCDVVRSRANSSFLTKTFNDLWCSALNNRARGVTHFAMIHADIMPDQAGWLDILVAELERLDADMICAVSPIKTEAGWTSVAVDMSDGDDPWVRRRLTMREVYELPETFGADDVGGPLLLNTGLWVCRLDRPWAEQVCFDVVNRMVRRDGLWHAEAIPEDWLFSAALNRLGCKLYATRKVTLGHDGGKVYGTDRAWGTQATDEVYAEIAKRRGAKSHAEDQVHEGVSGEGCGVPDQASGVAGAARAR